ncbi:MAG: CBS domain-containing protein, partial [Clostridia bacterium]|nr:CBS domain-containing protein [Clostridia bacterium]
AEPHDDIVKQIENLAELISKPPHAIDRVGNKEVITIAVDVKISVVMELMARTGYSNLPVYEDNKLLGVINARKLLNVLGNKVAEGVNLQEYIENTSVVDVVSLMGDDYFFVIADENLTIDAAMNYFENNRKLMIILLTKDGKESGKPLGIISHADIIDMKKILDIY